jgi:hypothetical protein
MKHQYPHRDDWPNILIIAGTGRNSGKTSLAERIIRRYAKQLDITAVKISPHFHMGTPELIPLVSRDSFNLYEETARDGGKDSARMLAAGARKVYYLEVADPHLQEAFNVLSRLIGREVPVVIESPALRRSVIPGVYLVADHPQCANKKASVLNSVEHAEQLIRTDRDDLDAVVGRIFFRNSAWYFKQ